MSDDVTSDLWWISWYEIADDYRPTVWPPPDGVLAYWCSGERDDGAAMLVALVRAETEEAAFGAVRLGWQVDEKRFSKRYDRPNPPNDRFPPPKWSTEMGRWPWSASGAPLP